MVKTASKNDQQRYSTNRLSIKRFTDDEFEISLALYSDPVLTHYFDHGLPRSREETISYLESRSKSYSRQNRPYGIFSVYCNESDNFLGQIDVVPTGVPGQVEIGWIFTLSKQSRGYCTEAIKQFLIPYIYEIRESEGNMPIKEIIATAHPENIPSQRVMYKTGLMPYRYSLRYDDKPRIWFKMEIYQ